MLNKRTIITYFNIVRLYIDKGFNQEALQVSFMSQFSNQQISEFYYTERYNIYYSQFISIQNKIKCQTLSFTASMPYTFYK